jgi:NADH:ubiquinone reductase (H+-translocating)
MSINIKRNQLKRVVIVGGGLGGLRLAEDLCNANLQVVLIDKNNFHQFPPLIYQIASAGIDPSSISFPFRQIFRKRKNFYFRMAEARAVFPDKKILQTSIGKIEYDYLVFAAGTTTNFYGNANIEKWAIPMKTVSEAMGLRNAVLSNLERALTCATEAERQELLNVVIVGGGATGVEIAGALSEMKRYVIPYDYPDMDSSLMHILLQEPLHHPTTLFSRQGWRQDILRLILYMKLFQRIPIADGYRRIEEFALRGETVIREST